jgi:ABC-type glycerol-3-phosphate transport system substrate-binding protein
MKNLLSLLVIAGLLFFSACGGSSTTEGEAESAEVEETTMDEGAEEAASDEHPMAEDEAMESDSTEADDMMEGDDMDEEGDMDEEDDMDGESME